MAIMSRRREGRRKPKLPRKRKKACIKAQGRESYYSTVRLALADNDDNCKFWVNSTVRNVSTLVCGVSVPMPTPTRYW